jgi:hypothetical protein
VFYGGTPQKKTCEKYVCKRLPFGANPLWVEPPVGSLSITRPLSNLDPLCTQMGSVAHESVRPGVEPDSDSDSPGRVQTLLKLELRVVIEADSTRANSEKFEPGSSYR